MLINPYIYKASSPPVTPGDLTLVYGSQVHNTSYQGVVNYWYEYNYSCQFIPAAELTSIPNNAHIYKIQFQVDNSTNGIYTESKIDMWMGSVLPSYTQFPLNVRVNLDSATDGTWNNQLFSFGKTKVISNGSRTYQQVTADPDFDRWVDLTFDFNFTYTAGNALCYSFLSSSGLYTSGSSTNPKHKGINLSGTQPRLWAQDDAISSPFFDTSFVNYDLTFKPNIKIFWT